MDNAISILAVIFFFCRICQNDIADTDIVITLRHISYGNWEIDKSATLAREIIIGYGERNDADSTSTYLIRCNGVCIFLPSCKLNIIFAFAVFGNIHTFRQINIKLETADRVFIIEEINRGNCAQIFGDLFQLLDRDANGKSEYGIKADADLKSFLEEELGEDNPGIKDGELCLPSNLYIYATMNTSDQSLFPIDSAFKRRWDWEYEPIKYKNTGWKIVIDGTGYSWVSFQRIVNEKILRANNSEDKMLGDYFVNPSDGVITDKVLLNKILFYLWNDVCKDGEGDIFKVGETEDISFSELYGENGIKTLKKMMFYLGVTDPDGNKVTIENNEENTEL